MDLIYSILDQNEEAPRAGLLTDRRIASASYQAAGVTITWCLFIEPLTANDTWPSTRANKVWSLPTPTLVPGWNLVPRWRTMIEPALMSSPPKAFTPSIFGLESRPLRVEPPP